MEGVHTGGSGGDKDRRSITSSSGTVLGEGWVSVLPESLLVHIVSSFPLVDVISLATVSKQWQYLWTMVPNLVFDQALGGEEHVEFVEKTLSLRRSMMKIERLSLPLYGDVTAARVDRWIDVAAKGKVDDLDLRLDIRRCSIHEYTLPEQMYSGWYLKKLTLSCISVEPVGLISWNSLKTLSLSFCFSLTNQTLDKLLKGSPLLELLTLKSVSGFNRLQVDSKSLKKLILDNYSDAYGEPDDCRLNIIAPHLQSLTILSYGGKNIPLLNCSSLVDACLHFEPPCHSNHSSGGCLQRLKMSLELFESLSHVENLTIDKWLLQVMSVCEEVHIPSLLLNCKSLTLETGLMEWEIPGLVNLLRRAPYLETLDINIFDAPRHCESCNFEKYTELCELEASLDHLKLVNIHVTVEQLKELDVNLVGFILKNAKVLKKMHFYPHNCPPQRCHYCDRVTRLSTRDLKDELLDVVITVLCFRRARKAKIRFRYEGFPDLDEDDAESFE